MKYFFLSLISALLLSISWPTYGVPFFLFISLVPLLSMEHDITKFSKIKRKGWAVFGYSYLTFLVWNLVTTGWLYGSKNPDGTHSIMAVAFPVLANSLLYSMVFISYHYYKKIQGTYWGLVFFVAVWMSFEKFHLSWELTWPWLNLGNAFAEYPKLIQWYDTLGATGGSFWVLLSNVLAFYTLRIWEAGRKKQDLIKNIIILSSIIFLPIIVSLLKYYSFNKKPVDEVSVLLLQPDLDPYVEKYSKDSIQILSELLDLAEEYSTTDIDFYIAPETAVPGSGSISEKGMHNSLLINTIKNYLSKKENATFITGISSHRFFTTSEEIPKNAYQTSSGHWVESYNSAAQIIPNKNVEVYHKGKLVPGVEIFPYMNTLKPLLGDVMLDMGGTVASLGIDKERSTFINPFNKAKFAPIICYESIYGEFTTDYIKRGANILSIMTNDSWWGVSEGHRQLLSYAKLRAIENRREIVRSANSGISAHINALGEIEESTLYGDQTALYAKAKLYEDKTFYTRAGDILSRISIFILGFLIFYTTITKLKEKRK